MTDTRVRYLDGLRGLLAVIVFLHHFFYTFFPEIIFGGTFHEFSNTGNWTFYKIMAFTPINLLFNPGAAIHFFFLLSGYVQSYNYFKKPDLTVLQRSFIKRYFRLALPVLAVIMLVFIFHKMHLMRTNLVPFNDVTSSWIKSMLPDNLSFFMAIRHALADCFMSNSRYYQVLWTMPIELLNSWMVLILLFVTHNIKNKKVIFILWLIAQLFFIQIYYSAAFTIGLLVCYAQLNSETFKKIISNTFFRVSCLLLGLYFASYPYVGFESSTKNSMYFLISFFEKYPHIISYLAGDTLLFCFLLDAGRLKTILSTQIFQFFGAISFMFYLLHLLILFSFTPWLYNTLFPVFIKSINLTITCLVSFLLITGVSYLFYKLVDKPILKMCSVCVKKIFSL